MILHKVENKGTMITSDSVMTTFPEEKKIGGVSFELKKRGFSSLSISSKN